jgi:hypothetical protein
MGHCWRRPFWAKQYSIDGNAKGLRRIGKWPNNLAYSWFAHLIIILYSTLRIVQSDCVVANSSVSQKGEEKEEETTTITTNGAGQQRKAPPIKIELINSQG